jgi:hypothetical protein
MENNTINMKLHKFNTKSKKFKKDKPKHSKISKANFTVINCMLKKLLLS